VRLFHKWTKKRIVKAIYRFRELISRQEWKNILSQLGRIYFSDETPEDYQALTAISQDGKYFVVFFLPHLWYESNSTLLLTVAHEFAHVLLGHCHVEVPRLVTEEQVHHQLEAWGFEDKDFEIVSQYLKEHPEI
jgi:hypothetical protein